MATTTSSSTTSFGPHVGLGRPAVKAPAQVRQQMASAAWTSLWSPSAAGGWLHVYWAQQAASLRAYDLASCALKVFLLIGNVKRSATHDQMLATLCAAGKPGPLCSRQQLTVVVHPSMLASVLVYIAPGCTCSRLLLQRVSVCCGLA